MISQTLIVAAVTLLAIISIALAVKAVRWAKKGTKGGALLVTIAFPNPEQPPPQQQVDEQLVRKKDAGSGGPAGFSVGPASAGLSENAEVRLESNPQDEPQTA